MVDGHDDVVESAAVRVLEAWNDFLSAVDLPVTESAAA
jgi:hypothetical protein